jgi:hypothetical protein
MVIIIVFWPELSVPLEPQGIRMKRAGPRFPDEEHVHRENKE